MYKLIRYLSYPLLMGGCITALWVLYLSGAHLWPWASLVSLGGILSVGLLERIQPFHRAWLIDHLDTTTDLTHSMVNLSIILFASNVLFFWTPLIPTELRFWPITTPEWMQLLLVGLTLDFSLYTMHWLSHQLPRLWQLHAIHHSPRRLYWLNAERRHPVHAIIMAGPGLFILALLGVPQHLVTIWFCILTVHLAFQHANLDYTIGFLRGWIGVAETHRWHHKREFEDAQVNFGEFFLIWDRLFGTYYADPRLVAATEVGLHHANYPTDYWPQFLTGLRTEEK